MRAMSSDGKSPLQLLVEERTGREIEGLLRELYVDRRHSDREIAEALQAEIPGNVTRSTVKQWRQEFGITRDERPAVSL